MSDIDFDVSRSPKAKFDSAIGQPKTPPANKLFYVTSRIMSNNTRKYSYKILSSTTQYLNDLDFDFQGHSGSNMIVPLDSTHVVSYYCLIVT